MSAVFNFCAFLRSWKEPSAAKLENVGYFGCILSLVTNVWLLILDLLQLLRLVKFNSRTFESRELMRRNSFSFLQWRQPDEMSLLTLLPTFSKNNRICFRTLKKKKNTFRFTKCWENGFHREHHCASISSWYKLLKVCTEYDFVSISSTI